jgi:methionyl-tRNA formyltransferase
MRYRQSALKIAYFGLPLGALLLSGDGHDLGLVVLSPVDAPGRFRLLRQRPDALDALRADSGYVERRADAALSAEPFDLLVSWFWTRKLPGRWLSRPRLGGLGVHPSLLPRHRGPNPYFWSIDAGDHMTGVTVHRLNDEYDTGDVLASRSLSVGERNSWQLARALDRPSLALLRETLACLSRGEAVPPVTQDESLVTWAPEPSGEELRVNFGWATERVLRRIRALSPTPGLALEVEGVPLFVTRAEPAETFIQALFPGEAYVSDDSLTLRTGDGAIRVTRAAFPYQGEGEGEHEDPDGRDAEAKTAAEVVALMKRGKRA